MKEDMVAQLEAEIARLGKALAILKGPVPVPKRPAGKHRGWSPAQRAAVAKRMKAYWKAKKAGK